MCHFIKKLHILLQQCFNFSILTVVYNYDRLSICICMDNVIQNQKLPFKCVI